MNKSSILYRTLARALSMKRPHDSEGTRRLTDWLQLHAPTNARIHRDEAGNLHIDTRVSPLNTTLFTAHVDTVHRVEGPNKIAKDATHWRASGAPLGADDGAGCAMLMHLMTAGIPAYYLFTQGEECGGIGAKFVGKDVELLKQFDRAIAFDRRGIDSVITHQGFSRTASDAFAEALADQLNAAHPDMMYLPDDTGVYTDTAEFTDVIPECTNISVGYDHEHSANESLNIHHFVALSKAVLRVQWDSLPTDRDPTKIEHKDWKTDYAYGAWGAWGAWGATSVHSSLASAYDSYQTIDDEDFLRTDLLYALEDAAFGQPRFLIEMMCESVYPEEPELAEHFIDRKKLTERVIKQARHDAKVYDPNTVLCGLFDTAYKE